MTLGGLIAIGTTSEALKLYKRRAHTQVQGPTLCRDSIGSRPGKSGTDAGCELSVPQANAVGPDDGLRGRH